MLCMRVLLVGLVLLLSGCAAEANTFGASDERFVETMVELRRAALTAGADTAEFMRLRDAVLEEQGVTEEELRAYVEARGGDLEHMAAVWDSVVARLSDQEPE